MPRKNTFRDFVEKQNGCPQKRVLHGKFFLACCVVWVSGEHLGMLICFVCLLTLEAWVRFIKGDGSYLTYFYVQQIIYIVDIMVCWVVQVFGICMNLKQIQMKPKFAAFAMGLFKRTWGYLKNVHLSPEWLTTLEKRLHRLKKDKFIQNTSNIIKKILTCYL